MGYVLIAGATSDIGRAVAREFARGGYDLYLAARNTEGLERDVDDLSVRFGVSAVAVKLDILDYPSHDAFYRSLLPSPEGIVCLVGTLGDQGRAEHDQEEFQRIIDTNFTGCARLLNIVAKDFEHRKSGFIIGVSSVAGDRGRASNYVYGSAKAALTTYLSGLRNRLSSRGVHVMTVKPGFVNTKMTEGMPLNPALTAEPQEVARDIFRALKKKKDCLYTKWFWRLIMLIIRHIPERIFKRLSL